ncbi:MAG: response regulator transcription factor [Bacteroidota bacterium]|jgi:DNA-binding response OmpR family regulator
MHKKQAAHLLLVEDESAQAYLLKEHLRLDGFTSRHCKDGEEGWDVFQHEKFDLVVLDVNMPKKSGFELARLIRSKNQAVPIIFLTANSSEQDKLKGFEIGGDEYITKPFSVKELSARIHAILKRIQVATPPLSEADTVLKAGNSTFDITNHIYRCGATEKKISATESELLKLFAESRNQLLSRNTLLLHIWGRDDYYTARNLDVYINKLRKIIKDDPTIEIVNIHGSGFKFVENTNHSH